MLAVLALTFLGLLNRPLSAIVNQLWSFLIKGTSFVELLWGIDFCRKFLLLK